MHSGSNCVPEWRSSSASASSTGRRGTVGPVGGHRLEGVRHHDDARLERHVAAREAVGVAAAVEALVVMQDPPRLLVQLGRRDDVGPEVGGALRMTAASSAVSAAGFWRIASGDPDLADVVQEAGDPDPRHPIARRARARRRSARTARPPSRSGCACTSPSRRRPARAPLRACSGDARRAEDRCRPSTPCRPSTRAPRGGCASRRGAPDRPAGSGRACPRPLRAQRRRWSHRRRACGDPVRRRTRRPPCRRPHRELVAADPKRSAVGRHVRQRVGEPLEQLVAGLVPARVVRQLEAVEINDREREPAAGLDEAVEALVEARWFARPVKLSRVAASRSRSISARRASSSRRLNRRTATTAPVRRSPRTNITNVAPSATPCERRALARPAESPARCAAAAALTVSSIRSRWGATSTLFRRWTPTASNDSAAVIRWPTPIAVAPICRRSSAVSARSRASPFRSMAGSVALSAVERGVHPPPVRRRGLELVLAHRQLEPGDGVARLPVRLTELALLRRVPGRGIGREGRPSAKPAQRRDDRHCGRHDGEPCTPPGGSHPGGRRLHPQPQPQMYTRS